MTTTTKDPCMFAVETLVPGKVWDKADDSIKSRIVDMACDALKEHAWGQAAYPHYGSVSVIPVRTPEKAREVFGEGAEIPSTFPQYLVTFSMQAMQVEGHDRIGWREALSWGSAADDVRRMLGQAFEEKMLEVCP